MNVLPTRTIFGASMELTSPGYLALDAHGFLYVPNVLDDSIRVFAPGADGNAAPVRSILGASTGLDAPQGIAVDGDGNMYVANGGGSVLVFAPTASRDTAPSRTIAGSSTGLVQACAVTVSTSRLLVGDCTGKILQFPLRAHGNVAPTTVIGGVATAMTTTAAIALDSSGNIYATTYSGNSVLVFAPDARGNAAPLQRLVGPSTSLAYPTGVTVAPDRTVLVANYFGSSVTAYRPLMPFAAPGKVAALKVKGKVAAHKRKVSWQASAVDGGLAVSQYRVVVKRKHRTLLTKTVKASKHSVKLREPPREREAEGLRVGDQRHRHRAREEEGVPGPHRLITERPPQSTTGGSSSDASSGPARCLGRSHPAFLRRPDAPPRITARPDHHRRRRSRCR